MTWPNRISFVNMCFGFLATKAKLVDDLGFGMNAKALNFAVGSVCDHLGP